MMLAKIFQTGLPVWAAFTMSLANTGPAHAQAITWKLTDTAMVGGLKPTVLGAPKVVRENKSNALFFDGIDDGLIVPANPVSGWPKFTVEIRFKPDGDGPKAPRMLHFEDSLGNRCTIEARITPDGQWYLDTFLKNGPKGKGLTLIDSTLLHPTDQWYWATLVFDGSSMTSYVNGKKEGEGKVDFPVMTSGRLALGVRLNRVNWFKGQISEVRFR